METIVKQTREVGTSAGVLLPRSWLNKQVVVTLLRPSKEEIARDVFNILIQERLNSDVKGIYLYGSYARGDHDENSDVDLFVITHKTNKLIRSRNYELLLVTEENFSKNLATNLNYLTLLKEAEVIVNSELIQRYKSKNVKFNTKKQLSEIERVNRFNRDTVETCGENGLNIPDGVVYSIVLRLREIYMIKDLISNKHYSKEEFLRMVGEKTYSAYLRVKRNGKELNTVSPEELTKILDLSEKWLKELKE